MDEKPNEIMQKIEDQRNRLGQNIDELERRVKDTADVKAQFERHPMAMVGLAFGGGLLLSSMMGSGSKSKKYSDDWSSGGRSSRRRGSWDASGSSQSYTPPQSRYASGNYSSGSGSSYSSGSSYEPQQSSSSSTSASPSSATMSAISGWLQNSKIGEQKDKALETFDHMGAAFLAIAADKVKDFLDSALPGFKQHLEAQEGKGGSPRQQSSPSQQWPGSSAGQQSTQVPTGERSRPTSEQRGTVQQDASGSSYQRTEI